MGNFVQKKLNYLVRYRSTKEAELILEKFKKFYCDTGFEDKIGLIEFLEQEDKAIFTKAKEKNPPSPRNSVEEIFTKWYQKATSKNE